jgi:hypothetical protein
MFFPVYAGYDKVGAALPSTPSCFGFGFTGGADPGFCFRLRNVNGAGGLDFAVGDVINNINSMIYAEFPVLGY